MKRLLIFIILFASCNFAIAQGGVKGRFLRLHKTADSYNVNLISATATTETSATLPNLTGTVPIPQGTAVTGDLQIWDGTKWIRLAAPIAGKVFLFSFATIVLPFP